MSSSRPRLPWYIRLQRAPGKALKWLADLGAALVWPIESAFAAVGRTAMSVSERFEGLESLLLRLGYALLWPLRMLWAMFVRAAHVLLPESVRHVLLAPLRGLAFLGAWLVHAFVRIAESLNLDGAVLWLAAKTRWLWYPFAAVAGFLHAWLSTRNYRQLLWGLPAVLIFAPILGAATWTWFRGPASVAPSYRLAVKAALAEKDYKRVHLFERKLAQLGVDSQMTDYQTAAALALDDKLAEAYERMQVLAPLDQPGYPPAHYWIIQHLLEGKLEVESDEARRLMGIHLDHLQTLGVKGPEIDLLRAFWLARGNQLTEAADVLEPLINRLPPAAVMRMEIDLSLGRLADARSDARAIRSHMEDRERRGVPLAAQDLRSWAIAEELLGNLDKSRELVRQWVRLEPQNLEARKSLSELCRREFQELLGTPDPDPQMLADLFIEAAEMTDDPHLLQRQVGYLYRQRDRIPVARQVVELVAGSPRTQSAILEAAGTAAAEAGNFEQAKTYLVQAVEKDPKNAIAWNNYAYILIQGSQPNYPEALKAVNKALEVLPDEFHFRETRGQILVGLEQWKEAIADLEFAVNAMPTSQEVHLALAKAYEAVGEEQLARLHRQQAQ